MVPDQTEEQLSRNRLMMLFQDPPEHTATRSVVNRGFTPRMIGKLEDHIREICHDLVGAALERGSADFVADIAAPLPLYVICELLGAPPRTGRRSSPGRTRSSAPTTRSSPPVT
nr:hypothetical protein GCM10020093_003730 [Planobispora longispora]